MGLQHLHEKCPLIHVVCYLGGVNHSLIAYFFTNELLSLCSLSLSPSGHQSIHKNDCHIVSLFFCPLFLFCYVFLSDIFAQTNIATHLKTTALEECLSSFGCSDVLTPPSTAPSQHGYWSGSCELDLSASGRMHAESHCFLAFGVLYQSCFNPHWRIITFDLRKVGTEVMRTCSKMKW